MTLGAATRRYWAGRFVLYRCFDNGGRLIYIGQTADLPRRVQQHRKGSWWWSMVARVRLQVFADRIDMEWAERAAIGSEQPAFNNRYGHGDSTEHFRRSDLARRRLWDPSRTYGLRRTA